MSDNRLSSSRLPRPEANQLVAERGQPVIAVPIKENGRELVRYVVDLQTNEPVDPTDLSESVRMALSLAGAWSDLDWDETVDALDRIRHESRPTPPIEPAA